MEFNKIIIGATTLCNGTCKFCPRNNVDYMDITNLPFEVFDDISNFSNHIVLIGSFGDFIFHPLSLQIIEMFDSKNIGFTVETNANLHNDEYWEKMGLLSSKSNTTFKFVIDDLEEDIDRHRGTPIKKILHNIECFINAGGRAFIKTILFKFNEHQIPLFERTFKNLGVTEFEIIFSKNYDDSGDLSKPELYKNKMGTQFLLDRLNQNIKKAPLCKSLINKEIFINELGELMPCCGFIPIYHPYNLSQNAYSYEFYQSLDNDIFNDEIYKKIYSLYQYNKDKINLKYVSLMEAFNNEFIQYVYKNINNIMCKRLCSLENNTNFIDYVVKFEKWQFK